MRSRNSSWSPAQCFFEKISTSQKPRNPASSTQPRISPDVDAALAGQTAIQQQILGGRLPVADVEGEQVAAAPAAQDLLAQLGIPPQVVHVDRHADVRRTDGLGDVVGLAHGVDRRAIVGVHRVQRLDGQLDVGRLRVGQHRLDAGADLIARLGQRLARHRPAHQHHHRRAHRRGLVDGPAVVVERLGPARLLAVREEPAPTQRHDLQPVAPQQRARLRRIVSGQRVPPDRDPLHAGAGRSASAACSSGSGLVVMVWTHSRSRFVSGAAGLGTGLTGLTEGPLLYRNRRPVKAACPSPRFATERACGRGWLGRLRRPSQRVGRAGAGAPAGAAHVLVFTAGSTPTLSPNPASTERSFAEWIGTREPCRLPVVASRWPALAQ